MAATLKQLAAIRAAIADTESEIHAIDFATVHKMDAAARVKAFVTSLAGRVDEGYIGRCFTSAAGGTRTEDLLNSVARGDIGTVDRALALQAWLDPTGLETKLMTCALPYCADGGTSLAERPALLRKLDSRLHDLLVEEEAMIVELIAAGHEVYRRSNVDPLIVLGV